ncbi:unnamed protein product [Sphenostylis stenocarpa]|uniref:Uncharacterized protein n=1 Tax=Sphenostylis stenocarpa TaxID=92480 RepID=A0AA86SFX4_9FABA|nr:unnamed protein product [Sphenostylis stenocarpa]
MQQFCLVGRERESENFLLVGKRTIKVGKEGLRMETDFEKRWTKEQLDFNNSDTVKGFHVEAVKEGEDLDMYGLVPFVKR